ncbi:MAG: alpha-galactosidase [Clostridia bacterium]|nr:alpha-galactosidase [Clostridia bacterium]
MISERELTFKLDTRATSYIFRITPKGHPEHIYYGKRLPEADADALALKNTIMLGTTVAYDGSDPVYSLDTLPLEYSGVGKGDFRHSPIELIMPDGSFVCDFVYESHEMISGSRTSASGLPVADAADSTLLLTLVDKKYRDIKLVLSYSVFYDCDVITRSAELKNLGEGQIYVRRLMSFMMDIHSSDYDMMTLDGGWIKEMHLSSRPLSPGIHVNDSTSGDSSNRHNPAFLLKAKDATELYGEVIGFNLIYSGNHYSAVEVSSHKTARVMSGINPHCFLWRLKEGESLDSPEAVMSYSDEGINGMSDRMHAFVNSHVIPEAFRLKERPVVLNNWEATFFNFNRRKLLALARQAKALGAEMFVLDDGWFGQRNDDTRGLGDWSPNEKKLGGSLRSLAKKINKMGLSFGLWFEPECVNEDSDLYRTHPDWALTVPGREPSYGRNQLVLDLTRKEVRDYIVESVSAVLDSANIEYVKWDYNRHISDAFSRSLQNQGELYHRYTLGIYDVLRRIFLERHPEVLLETCSSGGNRFDLGMLSFGAQIWTSDDTDARERMEIQRGAYTFYPQSATSAHVSMTPNQQTLRSAPLSTRFNVAAFAPLGYELDPSELTPEERREVKEQIAFYKAHRRTLQFGRLIRYFPRKDERESWQAVGEGEIIASVYNLGYSASPERDILRIHGAAAGKRYRMTTVKSRLKIGRFGGLINHISPIRLKPDGFILRFINRHFSLTDGCEAYEASGEALRAGIPLAMQYSGTGYNSDVRITGDAGSTLYLIEEVNN